jgi:TRAP-type mannitol/chloroaromatic compound transport system permease small subunit
MKVLTATQHDVRIGEVISPHTERPTFRDQKHFLIIILKTLNYLSPFLVLITTIRTSYHTIRYKTRHHGQLHGGCCAWKIVVSCLRVQLQTISILIEKIFHAYSRIEFQQGWQIWFRVPGDPQETALLRLGSLLLLCTM